MEIRISKESEVSIRQQLAEQIVYLITTEKLKPGEALPSVRELARRLRIHRNTVSHAYQNLVRRRWLVSRRGRRVVVRAPGELAQLAGTRDLDNLVDTLIRVAREKGHSLQALRESVRERLLAEPPDHILVVEEEPGLRLMLREEIAGALRWPVASCSPGELAGNPGLAIGALVVTPQHALSHVEPLAMKGRPAVPIAFRAADDCVERIRKLRNSAVVAVASVSQVFLKTARSLLAPAVGRRHSLCEFLLPLDNPRALRAADLIFCDSVALGQVRSSKAVHYRLVATASLDYLASAMDSSPPT
jgi:DNA-binding transcriptional regulator YhcF (GntR family)